MSRFRPSRHRSRDPVGSEPAPDPEADGPSEHLSVTRAFGVSRVAGFSDGVFAVAITLLVFGLRVPDLADPTSAGELSRALNEVVPELQAYAQTFLIIGAFWVGHHRAFRRIAREDDRLAWLNLFFLMSVSFMPFPATLVGRYPENRTSVILVGGSLAAVSLTYAGIWAYAAYGRLFISGTTPIVRIEIWTASIMASLFLVSIPVAFANMDLAQLSGNIVLLVLLVSNRAYRRLGRRAMEKAPASA
jgi:uncharacterized membrane protein